MSEALEQEGPIGYRELIRSNANFRYLWVGQIISLLGDWFNLIASASLVALLTESGFAIGGLFVVRMLAPFLISPVAGVVADRVNRKHVLIVSDLVRAVTVFGFFLVQEPGDVWLVYVLTAVQTAVGGFFFPARNAILPEIVPKRGLGAANALTSATWSVMLALGAAIGGVVSGTWGIYPAFAVDGVTFFLSALVISRVCLEGRPGGAGVKKAAPGQYLEGLRYLRAHPEVLVVALHKAASALFLGSAFQVVQVAISKDVFVIGVGGGVGLGLMYAVTGIGTGLGPILARAWTKDRAWALRMVLVAGYVIGSLGLFTISPLHSFGVVLVGTFLRGFGSGIVWVLSTQLLLQEVPGHIQGRVFSAEFAGFTLMAAVGASLGGVALDLAPIGAVVGWTAALALVPAVGWALWMWLRKPG